MPPTVTNILTVDVEEWFVVEALAERVPREQWPELPSTLVDNCHRLLDLFARYDVRATWFILGWCAERFPALVEEIAASGHEVGCHSYLHRRVDGLNREEFVTDTRRALNAIIAACGVRPRGYRAPSWSLNERVSWVFEALVELGFLYDSSIFPIKHDIYGMPEAPRELFQMTFPDGRSLFELPATTYRVLGRNLPIGGGGYLRHAPLWYTRRVMRRLNRQGRPVVVYLHPWEIDPNPPRLPGLTSLQRFRTQGSTRLMAYKLDRLLQEFRFGPAADYVEAAGRRVVGFEQER